MQLNLIDILRYRRAHESSSEAEFINNYLIPQINHLGYKPSMDGAGNIWVEVEKKDKAPYLFVAHIDTCHRAEGMSDPIVEQAIIKVNPKDVDSGCLGADDGVGIYCNLRMIKAGVVGTYLFTRGEECGGIGAEFIAKHTPHKLEGFKLCVEVDRGSTDEIIYSQSYGECASLSFAVDLADQLGMGHRPSDGGVYTDNAEFGDIIPESVNISAGYANQHTLKETVNTIYVEQLILRLIEVDWGSLTIEREPGEYGSYGYGNWNYAGYKGFNDNPYDEFETLLSYVEAHPSRVAHFLDVLGVDVYEIEREWNENEESYELAVGMR